MVDLPFMMMNWSRFFADTKVEALSFEERGAYALLLGKMWLNQGWLSADERIISRTLGVDIRSWRLTYRPAIEPLLRREIDPHIGAIYTQKTLTAVRAAALDLQQQRAASTARARAAKAAKARRKPSVAEQKSAPVSEAAAEPVAATAAGLKEQTQKERALPIKKAESPFQPTDQGLGASSGEIVASGIDPAALAALRSKGAALTPPSPALLKTRIVANGKSPKDADTERDRDDQGALPDAQGTEPTDAPATGLFGTLAAARRKSEHDD
jgi:uncharacterized protein YdaU (DUF1376 family)